MVSSSGPDASSDVIYTVVGTSPAPTYFSVDNDGVVRVQTLLTSDNTVEYYVSLHNVFNYSLNGRFSRLAKTSQSSFDYIYSEFSQLLRDIIHINFVSFVSERYEGTLVYYNCEMRR